MRRKGQTRKAKGSTKFDGRRSRATSYSFAMTPVPSQVAKAAGFFRKRSAHNFFITKRSSGLNLVIQIHFPANFAGTASFSDLRTELKGYCHAFAAKQKLLTFRFEAAQNI
jgi:hypothetical protein